MSILFDDSSDVNHVCFTGGMEQKAELKWLRGEYRDMKYVDTDNVAGFP